MSFEASITSIDYRLGQYAGCPIRFRGPKVDLSAPYVAVLGSSEVYGRYVIEPFSALLMQHFRVPFANFGLHNAGLDAFVRDEALLQFASDAPVVVLQAMGAHNMSNRFYSVHPRRNDRFLRHSRAMQRVFNRVDFSDFVFTRHMLLELRKSGAEPFEALLAEMEEAFLSIGKR
jgi:hypothetical protein